MIAPRTALALLALGLSATTACSSNGGDAGCQFVQEVALPGTPLTTLPDARLIPLDSGFLLIGADATFVRWAPISAAGVLGTEQMMTLPDGVTPSLFAVTQTTAPADTILVGYLVPNGGDAELDFLSAPADGSGPAVVAPAAAVVFPGGATVAPQVATWSSPTGTEAGVGWWDAGSGEIKFGTVDASGILTSATVIDSAPSVSCMAYSPATNEPALSFLRHDSDAMPTWEKGERLANGGWATLKLDVAQLGTNMGCALGAPIGPESYALAWQDFSGSWLSVYGAPKRDDQGNVTERGHVMSYPFVAATDFGGPDVQPPLVGFAPFSGDYAILFARTRAVELWRLSPLGQRRSGALIFPSAEGNIGTVSSVLAGGALVATYADYTSSAATTSRWLVSATCN